MVDPETGPTGSGPRSATGCCCRRMRPRSRTGRTSALVILIMIATLAKGWWQTLVLIPTRLGRGVRLGEPPVHARPDQRADAAAAARHGAGRADERAAAGALRHRPRGDRVTTERRRLLELRGVTKSFGGLRVIDHLDLHVDEGEIVSVIGPNGAGKTTLFNLITGVYTPDSGEILLDGESLVGLQPHKITNKGIARTFQNLRLFLNMTVRENVMAVAVRSHEGDRLRVDPARLPRARREEKEIKRGRRRSCRFFGAAADGLPLGPARIQPLVREPPPARDRARDGDAAADPPARRAGRRDEPGRDARDHRADRRDPQGRATRSSSSSTTCTSSRGSPTA